MFTDRMSRLRTAMTAAGIDVTLLSVGADLPYFCGYEAMPLERLTMLVVPRDAPATLVVPRLEAPRVVERPDVFSLCTWGETDDPIEVVSELMGASATAAIGDKTWARFLVDLAARRPATVFRRASEVTGPIRARKDGDEVARLQAASAAVDRIAARLHAGEISLVGRTEAAVAADLAAQIYDEGHHRVNFTIVASGPNAASPHHESGERVIQAGEVVLCDFGGTMIGDDGIGYCSDITRCVHTGPVPTEFADLYDVLFEAQAAGVAAATIGTSCEAVDRAARSVIEAGGYGEYFIHRTGHGIGVEAHEDPYIVSGNREPLVAGHAFSIEPGIYVPGRFGARLEDIVVATDTGPLSLNTVDHHLVVVL